MQQLGRKYLASRTPPHHPPPPPHGQHWGSKCQNSTFSEMTMLHIIPILVSIITYNYVTMFGIKPRSLRCKSKSGWLEPQAKAMSNWLSRISPSDSTLTMIVQSTQLILLRKEAYILDYRQIFWIIYEPFRKD